MTTTNEIIPFLCSNRYYGKQILHIAGGLICFVWLLVVIIQLPKEENKMVEWSVYICTDMLNIYTEVNLNV